MFTLNPHKVYLSNFDEVKKNVSSISLENLSEKKQTNTLLESTKRKLKNAFDWMLYLSNKKEIYVKSSKKRFWHNASFITLTLPSKQEHKDTEIKALLNQFFTEFQKYKLLSNYIWKAERQENGNIHFHIVTDSYVPYFWLLKVWNRNLNRLKYIDNYSKKMLRMCTSYDNYLKYTGRKDTETSKKLYEKSKKMYFRNAPTVNVKNIILKKGLKEYLEKYIGKDEDKDEVIKGKRVGISRKLSQVAEVHKMIRDKKDDVYFFLLNCKYKRVMKLDYGYLYLRNRILDLFPKTLKSLIFEAIELCIKYESAKNLNDLELKYSTLSH